MLSPKIINYDSDNEPVVTGKLDIKKVYITTSYAEEKYCP